MVINLRTVALFCLATALLGCQTAGPTAEQVAAAQDAQCASFGHRKGSPEFANCRQMLFMQEERRREQTFAYVERLQANRPAPMQIDQSPPRSSMQCSTTMSPGSAQTNCY